jgi:hypothetical protein
MTSSQEPQLTRREMRERERLQQEQAASPTPNEAPGASTPTPAVAPQPVMPPAPVPAYAAPGPVSGAQQSSPYGQPSPAVSPSPYPSAPAPAPGLQAPPVASPPVYPVPPVAAPPVSFAPAPQSVAPAQPAAVPASAATTPERTLTRRELRAMLGDGAAENDDLDDLDEEIAGATAMSAPRAPSAAPYSPPSPTYVPTAAPPTVATPGTAPPASAVPRQPIPHQEAAASAAEQPSAAAKPVGHWTSQLDAPVDPQPYDQVLSRGGVGRGVPTTTNALILPSLPDHSGVPAPLADNGEIIVTGSIDLPRSYGATGVHPSQIDSSDVDRLFDQVEDGASAGAPVSATRAISTQSAAKAVMAPPSKEGMNVPLVLAVTAGVLALGVVATLVIGALTGLF